MRGEDREPAGASLKDSGQNLGLVETSARAVELYPTSSYLWHTLGVVLSKAQDERQDQEALDLTRAHAPDVVPWPDIPRLAELLCKARAVELDPTRQKHPAASVRRALAIARFDEDSEDARRDQTGLAAPPGIFHAAEAVFTVGVGGTDMQQQLQTLEKATQAALSGCPDGCGLRAVVSHDAGATFGSAEHGGPQQVSVSADTESNPIRPSILGGL